MKSRDALVSYLCVQQLSALREARGLGDPEPEHYAMAALLEELAALDLGLRLPAARVSAGKDGF